MSETSKPTLCPDWVYLKDCNIHIAKDRHWFKTYTEFESHVDISATKPGVDSILQVEGIGTVDITTDTKTSRKAADTQGCLILQDVLHIPGFACNVLGQPLTEHYTLEEGKGDTATKGRIKGKDGKIVGFFPKDRPLQMLKLKTAPGVDPNAHVNVEKIKDMPICRWSDEERQRWAQKKKDDLAAAWDKVFSPEQLEWINEKHESVDDFFDDHGVSFDIEDKHDQERARKYVDWFMAKGKEEKPSTENQGGNTAQNPGGDTAENEEEDEDEDIAKNEEEGQEEEESVNDERVENWVEGQQTDCASGEQSEPVREDQDDADGGEWVVPSKRSWGRQS